MYIFVENNSTKVESNCWLVADSYLVEGSSLETTSEVEVGLSEVAEFQ
jgi:tetrahydrodipicolinate N-succinyltransferase